MQKILVVDDNKYTRLALTAIIEDSGFKALTLPGGDGVLEEIESKKPDLVILDKRLPGYDGIEILREVKKTYNDLKVIILTAYADEISARKAIEIGAFAFLTKPFDNEELISIIKKAVKS
ncbi:MAG: response regulator [Ignavibacteria bacterium]